MEMVVLLNQLALPELLWLMYSRANNPDDSIFKLCYTEFVVRMRENLTSTPAMEGIDQWDPPENESLAELCDEPTREEWEEISEQWWPDDYEDYDPTDWEDGREYEEEEWPPTVATATPEDSLGSNPIPVKSPPVLVTAPMSVPQQRVRPEKPRDPNQAELFG